MTVGHGGPCPLEALQVSGTCLDAFSLRHKQNPGQWTQHPLERCWPFGGAHAHGAPTGSEEVWGRGGERTQVQFPVYPGLLLTEPSFLLCFSCAVLGLQ